jgi:hypothetical protein
MGTHNFQVAIISASEASSPIDQVCDSQPAVIPATTHPSSTSPVLSGVSRSGQLTSRKSTCRIREVVDPRDLTLLMLFQRGRRMRLW